MSGDEDGADEDQIHVDLLVLQLRAIRQAAAHSTRRGQLGQRRPDRNATAASETNSSHAMPEA
jgi:hypothetical protein